MVYRINNKYEDLCQTLEWEPTKKEMVDKMGMSEEQIETMFRAYRTHLPLNIPLNENKETRYLDLLENPDYIPYDEQMLKTSFKAKVDEILKDLTPRGEKILRMRFGFDGEPSTLEKIGKEINLSR
ncbi:MAG: sigma-70 domain-containing protein [Nitrospinota bacterium]|nr:sigma-70 domain-containing protein [Nitrospinota bacterium]